MGQEWYEWYSSVCMPRGIDIALVKTGIHMLELSGVNIKSTPRLVVMSKVFMLYQKYLILLFGFIIENLV